MVKSATVQSAGLSPGMVGLYRVVFVVPADADSGNLKLQISQNDIPANIGAIPIVP